MFEHSVKVPRHFKVASTILQKVISDSCSLKTLLFGDNKYKHYRVDVLYALISEAVKHNTDLDEIFTKTNILVVNPRLDPWLAKILAVELIYGKKTLPGKSKPELIVLSYKDEFLKHIDTPNYKIEEETLKKDNNDGPLVSRASKLAALALANLFLYSVAMFTLPFVAFFGTQNLIREYFQIDSFANTMWSVVASVVTVNLIIAAYAYKAYYEKEYDAEGNEIDQHAYPTEETKNKSALNVKED